MFGRAFGALDRHIGKGVLRRNSQPVPVSIDAYAGTGPDGQIWLAVPMVMMSGACSAIPVRRVAASVDSGEGGSKLIDRMMIVFALHVPLMFQFVQGLHGGHR